jgi:hypothetical protein
VSMSEDKDWAQGHTIDVFYRPQLNIKVLDEILQKHVQRKVSSFVYGVLRERKDDPEITLLKRYFAE